MKPLIRTLSLILILLIIPRITLSCNLVESVSFGRIDWNHLIVEADGSGMPDPELHDTARARQKASMDAERKAYQNLLNTVMAVRLEGDSTIGRNVKGKDEVLSKIEDILNGAKTVSTRYLSDGTIIKHLMIPLTGPLAQLLLPENIVPIETQKVGDDSADTATHDYTGLVVDARGLNPAPAMCIRIVDEQGESVYGPAFISREYAVQKGVCTYSINQIDQENQDKRVGKTPLIVRAIRIMPPGTSDLMISNTDAARIRAAVSHLFFLRKCRVLILSGDAETTGKNKCSHKTSNAGHGI
ncbi:MAG: hypothetical protein GXP53_12905 [Deltaproteobacteria bacterium]|nr:hypothetical protein [Deltaproteobacteria bacterium]